MATRDEFARDLFEDAKHSLRQARGAATDQSRQRHLRHALMSAFSFLELQIELIAQHFSGSDIFSVHEQGILAQREVSFERGEFKLKAATRYSRLPDRMQLLQHKFKANKLTERAWWAPLVLATDRRNSLAHPKEPVSLTIEQVEADLTATLQCANDLFEIVFAKGLPYAAFGLKPKAS